MTGPSTAPPSLIITTEGARGAGLGADLGLRPSRILPNPEPVQGLEAAGSPSQQALPSLAALTPLGPGPLHDSSSWPHHTWWILCPCLLGQAPQAVTRCPQLLPAAADGTCPQLASI